MHIIFIRWSAAGTPTAQKYGSKKKPECVHGWHSAARLSNCAGKSSKAFKIPGNSLAALAFFSSDR
ncbi:hypothetical protein HMPREF3038_01296 [Akkermansia sp. KLE1797]|nr:hypothetical protein HMPREF3038_01296 [Akkermansia sp. KLE1797]KXU52793.1 hypothetical protein HMPREF3039_02959 [Akkermansia sp. KLE1798]KZA04244.1 hypothetical protein HMPREF1326_02167 [Akkermansia sp. KLE1605]